MAMQGVTSANLMCGMTGYNGLGFTGGIYGGGYGMYGGYGINGDISIYEQNLENQYDLWQTQNGYINKPNVETQTIDNRCQDIGDLIAQGRTDDASEEIDKLIDELKQYPQYKNYNDKEIRAVLRNAYQNATGSDIIKDIEENTSSNFFQGVKQGLPFGGLAANKTTRAELIEQVTGVPQSKGSKTGEVAGSALTGAAAGAGIGAAAGAAIGAIGGPIGAGIGAAIGGIAGAVGGIFKGLRK